MTQPTLRPTPRAPIVLTLAALLGSTGAPACATGGGTLQPDAAVRVMVYNIHAGKDAAGQDNLDRVADLVRESGADLVLLQEVDRGTERSGGVDQVAVLSRLTGLEGAFGRTLDYQGGEYGIALLSRWTIRSHALHPLPVDPPQERAGGAYEPRGVLEAVVEAPFGPIRVLSTHLDASRDDHYRLQEVRAVLARVRSDGSAAGALEAGIGEAGVPVLLGGDFNAEPGTATLERVAEAGLRDAWEGCGRGPGLTFPADRPVKRIDYLFLGPGVRCEDARVLETEASDHRPALFRLALAGG